MTSYFEEIREMIYFEEAAYKDIYSCFDFYFSQDLAKKKNNMPDKLGISYAAWDLKLIQKE